MGGAITSTLSGSHRKRMTGAEDRKGVSVGSSMTKRSDGETWPGDDRHPATKSVQRGRRLRQRRLPSSSSLWLDELLLLQFDEELELEFDELLLLEFELEFDELLLLELDELFELELDELLLLELDDWPSSIQTLASPRGAAEAAAGSTTAAPARVAPVTSTESLVRIACSSRISPPGPNNGTAAI
jgi:hypothetical protein